MVDYSNIIKSIISSRMHSNGEGINASAPFHALEITFLDVIYSIILIERSLDIDFISRIDRDRILNYTVNDFISIATQIK